MKKLGNDLTIGLTLLLIALGAFTPSHAQLPPLSPTCQKRLLKASYRTEVEFHAMLARSMEASSQTLPLGVAPIKWEMIQKLKPVAPSQVVGNRFKKLYEGRFDSKPVFIKVSVATAKGQKAEDEYPASRADFHNELRFLDILSALDFSPRLVGYGITPNNRFFLATQKIEGQHVSNSIDKTGKHVIAIHPATVAGQFDVPVTDKTIKRLRKMKAVLLELGIGVYDLQIRINLKGKPYLVDTEEYFFFDNHHERDQELYTRASHEAFDRLIEGLIQKAGLEPEKEKAL